MMRKMEIAITARMKSGCNDVDLHLRVWPVRMMRQFESLRCYFFMASIPIIGAVKNRLSFEVVEGDFPLKALGLANISVCVRLRSKVRIV